jgi:flagellin
MDGVTLLTAAAAAADIEDHTKSQAAIGLLDTAMETVDTFRSDLGSKINRLNYAIDNLTETSTNTAAARSRVLDTDYAQATTELARTQIIQQAATAMLAQANQQPSSVLSLLQ